MNKILNCIFLIFVLGSGELSAQFSNGLSVETSYLKPIDQQYYWLAIYNENETYDYYRIQNDLGVGAIGLGLRSFGAQFLSDDDIQLGYSLGLGYTYFRSNGHFVYRGSSTNYRDSIINAFDDYHYPTNYHLIRLVNFFDIHWNISASIKLTNSFGFGIHALIKANSVGLDFDGAMINSNYPTFKWTYEPQLTESYERFSISYFASIDLFSSALFVGSNPPEPYETRYQLNQVVFNTFGIRIIPKKKVNKPDKVENFN